MSNIKVFTEYSFDKSIIRFEDYTNLISRNDLPYISISDDNFKSLYKLKTFVEEHKEVTPIIGHEFNIKGLDFYLIALNNKGLKSLIEFSNIKKHTIDFIRENQHNLVVCLGKPTENMIKTLVEKKEQLKEFLKGIDFYSLLYPNKGLNVFYNSLIKELSTKTLSISNVVYINESDKGAFNNYNDIMGYDPLNNTSHFSNDMEIPFLEQINVNLSLMFNEDFKPTFDFDVLNYLKRMINEKFKKVKNKKKRKLIIERLEKELELIESKGFHGFIYVVYDLVKYMKKNKILYNNRGSAGSSLVLYMLDIVLLNPLRYEFYFERFINEFRNELPDIDLDVQDDKINQVLKYLIDKYSEENIGKIISYSNLQFKSLTRKVLRSLNVESPKITQMTSKMINQHNNKVLTYPMLKEFVNSPEEHNLSEDEMEKYKDFYQYINSLFKYYPKLYSSMNLIGNIYQKSKHSSGIIVSNQSIKETFPVIKENDVYHIQFDKNDIEQIDIIKLDLLNSVVLKVISKTMNKVKLPYSWFYKKDLSDPNVYKEFSNLNTQGIFQFSSYTGQKVLEGSKVISFQDLFNRNACNRPGPLSRIPGSDKTLVDMYFENKNGEKNIKTFGGILKDTYGCLLFQEQILKISRKVAGYSLGEADQKVRKSLSSKNMVKIKSLEEEFVNSSINNGYSKDLSKETFNFLINFSKYSFNKPHASVYSYVSYKTMELKLKNRETYLNEYIKTASKREINSILEETDNKTVGLNINKSHYFTKVTKNKNFIGLNLVKNFNLSDYQKLVNVKPVNNVHQLKGIFSSKLIENLIKAGAFNFINSNRFILLNDFTGYQVLDTNSYNYYEQLKLNKEVIGINLVNRFSKFPKNIKDKSKVSLKGIIDFIEVDKDKNDNEYAKMKIILNDKNVYMVVFNDMYVRYKDSLKKGNVIDFEGIYNKNYNNINLKKII